MIFDPWSDFNHVTYQPVSRLSQPRSQGLSPLPPLSFSQRQGRQRRETLGTRLRLSLASRLNAHECARRKNTSGTLTTLGTIFNETAEEKLFISKGNEINCGIFSYFSWVRVFYVFYILSPIFTKIKRAPRKR